MLKFKVTVLVWETSNIQQEKNFYVTAANLHGATSKLKELINDNFETLSFCEVIK